MKNLTTLDTGTADVAGDKLKGEIMENRCSMGNVSRKGLTDISNLQQQPKLLNQGAKLLLQPASLGTKDYIDKLQQENMTLMKVLADRNKVIELSGIELQKLRINLEKFQQQNMILAQANSQMLTLKALKHELGCKNALLKAIKLELGTNKCGKAGESHDEEDGENKPCNMNRCGDTGESLKGEDEEDKPCNMTRKRQSYDLGPCNIKPVQGKEGVKNKRVFAKRQSARHKTQEAETTEDVIEVDDTKFLDSTCDDKVHGSCPSDIKPVQAKEGIDNKRVCLRRQSARFKAQEPETTEYMFEVDDTKSFDSTCDDKVHGSGPSDIKPVQTKEGIDNKRVCLKRQSARFKSQEPETTEYMCEVDDTKSFAPICDDKVVCLRRQSAKIRAQEPETSVDVFDVDDVRCLVSSTSDDKVHESGQLSSDSSVKNEQEEGNTSMSTRSEAQELRRVSVGRPLRRAVEKVQSYKEMKLNVKMRREV
ncbi:Shugoshin-1 [Gossypium australe]|uniref:Shugoshin-1 n=1 Tax=Gossypium australe TaxID=47621 RepID=A0A5B6W989_9ROSI|nr:Shugoshin-1 [Gossypium australe]